jgi:hypothetical protein
MRFRPRSAARASLARFINPPPKSREKVSRPVYQWFRNLTRLVSCSDVQFSVVLASRRCHAQLGQKPTNITIHILPPVYPHYGFDKSLPFSSSPSHPRHILHYQLPPCHLKSPPLLLPCLLSRPLHPLLPTLPTLPLVLDGPPARLDPLSRLYFSRESKACSRRMGGSRQLGRRLWPLYLLLTSAMEVPQRRQMRVSTNTTP